MNTQIKLFVSYKSTLVLIALGRITAKDLDAALFAFSAHRDYIFSDKALEKQYLGFKVDVQRAAIINVLRPALLKAEQEGRIAWEQSSHSVTIATLNEVLSKNNFRIFEGFTQPEYASLDLPSIQNLAAEQLPEIEVLF